jgi:AraC-like DNA-binding protein
MDAPALEYLGRPAPEDLRPWITTVWYTCGPRPQRYEKILPMPIVHLIVNLGEPYELLSRGTDPVRQTFASGFVSGLLTRYLVIENPPLVRNMGAEFRPYGIAAFSGVAVDSLTDSVRSSDDVMPGSGALRERAGPADSGEQALDALEDYLRGILRPDFSGNRVAIAACELIASEPGIAIAEVAERIGTSHKSLIANFRRHCGVTPKAFANLCRFHRFVNDLPLAGEMPRWSDLVAQTDYYDQAHFVRAFRSFTGFSPSEYVESMRRFGPEYPSFVPMDHRSEAGLNFSKSGCRPAG